jgi:hypothetical protein
MQLELELLNVAHALDRRQLLDVAATCRRRDQQAAFRVNGPVCEDPRRPRSTRRPETSTRRRT